MQFLDLEAFTRFGTKLDDSMEYQIQRGRLLRDFKAKTIFSTTN